MPHVSREKSESGFYHVVTKGDGGQIIFEDERDRAHIEAHIKATLADCHVKLHAYCLMANHVHFLLQDEQGELSAFMKAINENHAMYIAKKIGRVGHVFQGRFWSEPVVTDEHFLAALRYIHANPEPAGICSAADYRWSSYSAYRDADDEKALFVTTDFALSMLGGRADFEAFQQPGGRFARPFAGSRLMGHLSADELARVALDLLGRETLYGMRSLKPAERSPHLRKMAEAGFTASEIARLTGLGQPSVYKLLKE